MLSRTWSAAELKACRNIFASLLGRATASALHDLSLTFTVQYGWHPRGGTSDQACCRWSQPQSQETDLNGSSTRSDQHLFGEEPASESENLNKASVNPGFFFSYFFSKSIRGYTLETNETSCH